MEDNSTESFSPSCFTMALHSTFCPYCRNSFYLSDQAEGEVHCGHCSRLIHVQNHGSVRIIDNQYTGEPDQNVISTRANRNTLTKRRNEPDQVQPPTICVPDTPRQTLSKTAAALKQYVTPVFTGVMMFAFATVVLQVAGKNLPPDRQPEIDELVDLPELPPVPVVITPPPTENDSSTVSIQDSIDKLSKSVGTIIGEHGRGTGFMVRPGLLVTNYHVIFGEKLSDLKFNFPDHKNHETDFLGELVNFDAVNDLAVIRCEAEEVEPLTFYPDYIYKNGTPVVLIGTPSADGLVIPNFVTYGSLSREVEVLGHKQWALSLTTYGGNSGGPVIDKKTLEVVGVISSGFTNDARSFAVPHRFVKKLLAEAERLNDDERKLVNINHQIMYCLGHLRHQHTEQVQLIEAMEGLKKFFPTNNKTLYSENFSNAFNKVRREWIQRYQKKASVHLETTLLAEIQTLKKLNDCELEVAIAAEKAYETLITNIKLLENSWRIFEYENNMNQLNDQAEETITFIQRIANHAKDFGGPFTLEDPQSH